MHPHYKFQIVLIAIGLLGYVLKYLEMHIYEPGFNKTETEKLV